MRHMNENMKNIFLFISYLSCLGFVHIAHGLRERNLLSSIYSLTIAYPDTVPKTEVKTRRKNNFMNMYSNKQKTAL